MISLGVLSLATKSTLFTMGLNSSKNNSIRAHKHPFFTRIKIHHAHPHTQLHTQLHISMPICIVALPFCPYHVAATLLSQHCHKHNASIIIHSSSLQDGLSSNYPLEGNVVLARKMALWILSKWGLDLAKGNVSTPSRIQPPFSGDCGGRYFTVPGRAP